MRVAFHAELERLSAELGDMCELVADIMQCATAALVRADMELAKQVTVDLQRLDELNGRVNDRAFALLALQAPVARDLRVVVSAIQMASSADRMGGLAANVAKVARRHHPATAVPAEALDHFTEMGRIAVELANHLHIAVLNGDVELARRIRDDDAVMEDLHAQLFALASDDRWTHGCAAAADMILLGRFYGRFADQAAEIARRILFQEQGRIAMPDGDPLLIQPTGKV
jgi:phosphate transport system protein